MKCSVVAINYSVDCGALRMMNFSMRYQAKLNFAHFFSDQRKFTFRSPDVPSSSSRMTPPSTRSPYIDGCSPIKNYSPMRLGACRGTAQYQTSVIRIPIAVENHDEEDKENTSPAEARFPEMDNGINVHQEDSDTFAHGTHLVVTTVSIAPDHSEGCHQRLSSFQDIEGLKENNTVDMADAAEVSEENTWMKETIGSSNTPMTSFMTGITFSIESSRMCMSPLAESSTIPCDNSSIQVKILFFLFLCKTELNVSWNRCTNLEVIVIFSYWV